jgi:hypothetical protein
MEKIIGRKIHLRAGEVRTKKDGTPYYKAAMGKPRMQCSSGTHNYDSLQSFHNVVKNGHESECCSKCLSHYKEVMKKSKEIRSKLK